MKAQIIDEVEFRGTEVIQGVKDPSKRFKKFAFEDMSGRRLEFMEDLDNLPALPEFKRGSMYMLTVDIYGRRNGFGVRILGASPAMLDD